MYIQLCWIISRSEMWVCICSWHFLYLVLTSCPWWLLNFAWLVLVPPVERDGNPNRDGKLSQCILMLMDSAQLPTINLFLRCISVRCSSRRTRVISMQMNRVLHLLHVCARVCRYSIHSIYKKMSRNEKQIKKRNSKQVKIKWLLFICWYSGV